MSIILRPQWTSQPQGIAQIDWGNPVTRGLVSAYTPGITNADLTGAGSALASTYHGIIPTARGVGRYVSPTDTEHEVATVAAQRVAEGTVLWVGQRIGTPSASNAPMLFGIRTPSANSAPYAAIGPYLQSNGVINFAWNQAGTYRNATGGSIAAGQSAVVGLTVRSGSALGYQDGIQVASSVNASTINYSATSLIGFDNHGLSSTSNSAHVLGLLFNRALSAQEIWELSRNPWQVFQTRRIWVPVTVAAGGSYTLTASAGSFTQTGTAASLLRSRKVAADAGSLTFTGTAASLLRGRSLTATGGTFALTGADAALNADRKLTAGGGSFTLTGSDVTQGATLAADAASYALTGEEAFFLWTRVLAAGGGSFSLSGGDLQTEEEAPAKGGGAYRRTSGFVAARKRIALQRMLAVLTEEEPKPDTKKLIRAIKAGKPIEDEDKKPPVVMSEISAEKIAASLIPERVAVIEQAIAGGLDVQRVILRAIEIARERDDEDVLMLL